MGIQIRSGSSAVETALVAGYNSLRQAVALAGSQFHTSATATTSGDFANPTATALTVSAPNGSGTLGPLLTLCANLDLVYKTHIADASAHKVADTTNVVTLAVPTDLTTAKAYLNALQTLFNAHLTQTGVHVNNDGTNTSAAAAATTQGTADTLANDLKTKLNAHMGSAPLGQSIVLGPA